MELLLDPLGDEDQGHRFSDRFADNVQCQRALGNFLDQHQFARRRLAIHPNNHVSFQQTCGGRLAVVTEGGYDLQALRACLDATVDVLRGAVALDAVWRDAAGPDRRGRETVRALETHPLVAVRA